MPAPAEMEKPQSWSCDPEEKVMPSRTVRTVLGEAEGIWESNRAAPEPGKPVSRC